MPCRCDGYEEEERRARERRQRQAKKRFDRMARLLCFACGELMEDGLWERYAKECPDLKSWFEKHNAADVKRVRAAMVTELSKSKPLSASALATKFVKRAEKVHAVSRWHKKKWFPSVADQAVMGARMSREKSEKRRKRVKQALAKLSPQDRKILGL